MSWMEDNIMTVTKASEALAKPAPAAVTSPVENEFDDTRRHIDLGHRLSKHNRYIEAETCYRNAIELSPRHAIAHNNFGWVRQMQGDDDGALDAYEKALQFDPHLRVARRNLAVLLLQLGLKERSIYLWREE